MTTPAVVRKGAIITGDQHQYRYLLTRTWDSGVPVTWIMLNPSTADAELDDRTIGRCMGFARAWGYAGIQVVNLYAWRTKSPRALRLAEEIDGHDIVGPENDQHLRRVLADAHDVAAPVVAGWGAHGDKARVQQVYRISRDEGVDLTALAVNKDGSPKHPLYVKGDTSLTTWRPR